MKSTKEKVLQTLADNPRSNITEIADAIGINPISVRHHLTNLQADNLIASEEERHGVGRPRLVYFLTDEGLEKFPTRYYRLTNNLLKQIKETFPKSEVKKLFMGMADKTAKEYLPVFELLDLEEKLNLLKNVMAKEGYELQWKEDEDYQTIEISCPFYKIGRDHPEICLFDKTLIANLLSIPEEDIIHVQQSNNRCAFKIAQTKK